jgi:hypothetical protein
MNDLYNTSYENQLGPMGFSARNIVLADSVTADPLPNGMTKFQSNFQTLFHHFLSSVNHTPFPQPLVLNGTYDSMP